MGFGLWVWPSKNVLAFFLRSLMPKNYSGMQEIIYLSCISPQKIAKGDHPILPIRFTVTQSTVPPLCSSLCIILTKPSHCRFLIIYFKWGLSFRSSAVLEIYYLGSADSMFLFLCWTLRCEPSVVEFCGHESTGTRFLPKKTIFFF